MTTARFGRRTPNAVLVQEQGFERWAITRAEWESPRAPVNRGRKPGAELAVVTADDPADGVDVQSAAAHASVVGHLGCLPQTSPRRICDSGSIGAGPPPGLRPATASSGADRGASARARLVASNRLHSRKLPRFGRGILTALARGRTALDRLADARAAQPPSRSYPAVDAVARTRHNRARTAVVHPAALGGSGWPPTARAVGRSASPVGADLGARELGGRTRAVSVPQARTSGRAALARCRVIPRAASVGSTTVGR